MIQRSDSVSTSQLILGAIENQVTEHQFLTWFKEVSFELVGSDQVVVEIPSRFHHTYIRHRFLLTITDAIETATGISNPRIEFRVPELLKSVEESNDSIPLNREYVFDEFVVGPSNRLAHAAALAVSENPGQAYNPLFLYGPVGLGKTHLLQAVAHRYRELGIRNVIYLSCASFTADFIRAVETGNQDSFRRKYREAGALLIDDVQLLADKERTQEEFFHTFNAIYNSQRQIFLTSDSTPSDIQGIGERLVSRFKLGLVAPLSAPTFETRVAILMRKCRNLGLNLHQDVAEFVAKRLHDNVRELEGATIRLHTVQSIEKLELNLENVRSSLADILGPERRRGIDLESIVKAVESFYSIQSEELKSKRRSRSIVVPRQICMFLARKHTDLSLNEIGHHFGGRDHSTVLHSVEKIGQQQEKDRALTEAIRSIESSLE